MDLHICRYLSKLTLFRVRLDLTGSYTATASNEDGSEEVVFNLEVKGQRWKTKTKREECLTNCLFTIFMFMCLCVCAAPPKITALSEISKQAVVCVGEGAPTPSVTWYTCHNSHR